MRWNILADTRYSVRGLLARPGFTVVVVLTLAVGIGVNVAIFSLTQQILLRPLPVAEPERLVNLSDPGPKLDPKNGIGALSGSGSGGPDTVFSYPMFRDLQRAQVPFVDIAAHRIFDASVSTQADAQRTTGTFVSGSYFPVLGLRPALGRLLGPQDDRVDGAAESVVLSYAYWQREFGADTDIIGRSLIVNGTPLSIVGVAPPEFNGTVVGVRTSLFVPLTFRSPDYSPASIPNHDNRGFHWVHLFARLDPGVDLEQAAARINPLYRAIVNEIEVPLQEEAKLDEAFRTRSLVLQPGAQGQSLLLLPARERLPTLFALSGLVLILSCLNIAGLMLVRGSARKGELAVRVSMGATRGRLATLMLAESVLLALPAALLSLPVALLTLSVIASTFPAIQASPFSTFEASAAFDVSVDFAAMLVAISGAMLSALAFTLLPVTDLMRSDPAKTLQGQGARQTIGRGIARYRSALAMGQVSLSVALLAVTFLFAQSLANIARSDLGFDIDSVVTFSISPQASGYTAEASDNLLELLKEELAATPGVVSVASSRGSLLSGSEDQILVREVEGVDLEEFVAYNAVSSGFFRTLGVDLLAGREFRDSDSAGPQVAIVNQRFAERFRLAREVVGARVRFTTRRGENVEIVGFVSDAKFGDVTDEFGPQLFLPLRHGTVLYVRGSQAPKDLLNVVRETVARIDPIVPILNLRSMQDQVRESLATERFIAGASTTFALLATALAGLGLYGVLAYGVALRSREIALRFALGAPATRIRGMVLRQVAGITLAGVALGVVAGWLLGRTADSLLFGVGAGDPTAFAAAGAVLTAVTLAAAYIPARTASGIDPMTVLRHE